MKNNWTYELIDKPVVDEMIEIFEDMINRPSTMCTVDFKVRFCFDGSLDVFGFEVEEEDHSFFVSKFAERYVLGETNRTIYKDIEFGVRRELAGDGADMVIIRRLN